MLASVLYELAKTNPEIVLAEMNEIITNGSPEEFGNYYSFSNILSRIASLDDPSFLEMIQKWPIKYQNEVEAQVIQREFSKDMTNAIAKISAKPALMSLVDWSETGASDYLITNFATLPDNVRGYLVANAFSVIDRSNVEKWLAMDLSSMGINERQRRNIVNNSFYYLRPEKSLLALNHFEPGSEDYKEVRNNIFSRLGNDLDVLRQFDQALTDPEDRQELAARIAAVENEKAAMELAKEASQQLSPAQQTSLLQKMLDLKEGNSSAFALSISKMKEQELADFSRQFTALSNEQQTQIAGQFMNGSGEMQFLPESMATQLIKTALNSGQKQFETRAIVAASTMTHRKLMTSPTEATVWIDELPEGKGKECSQINLAYNWALYDFNAAQQWVQTLPEASRKKLEAQLKLNGIDIFSK